MDLLDVLGKVDPGYSQLRGKYLGKRISPNLKKMPLNVVFTSRYFTQANWIRPGS
jgi:hypothetical protein